MPKRTSSRRTNVTEAQLALLSETERQAVLGQLVTGMLHDLLNPLAAAALAVEALSAGGKDSKTAHLYIQHAKSAARRLEDLVSVFRRYFAKQDIAAEISLKAEILDTMKVLGHKARLSGVELRFEPKTDAVVFGSPAAMSCIIFELILNAIGSYASLPKAKRIVRVRLLKRGQKARIEVEDKGGGMPKVLRSKIFEPFCITKDKGHGLGLWSAKKCADLLKGRLILQDIPRGSIFIAEFPLFHKDIS